MKLIAWFKRNFALGVVLPSVVSSLIAAFLFEWIRPGSVSTTVQTFWGWILGLWGWLFAEVPVYRATYWILALYFVVSVIVIAVLALQSLATGWRRYTRDTFFGIVWRWAYDGPDGFVYRLAPFCPECDRHLEAGKAENSMRAGYDVPDTLICRHHGVIYAYDGSYARLEAIVKDEISRKLRNGGWEKIVERQAIPPD